MKARRMRYRFPAFALCVAYLSGCQTVSVTSSTGSPLPPDPVAAPTTPEDTPVTNVVAISPYVMNRDANRSDFPIAVYLYAQPFPAPKWQSGSFTFELYEMRSDSDSESSNPGILLERSWTNDEAYRLRNRSIVGDFYRFEIALPNARLKSEVGDVLEYRICFIPDSGDQKVYSSVKTIRMR